MVSGFFLGGTAKGFETALTSQNQAQYQQGLLQLEQQRQQQQQQNQQRSQYMQLYSQGVEHLGETMSQLRIAHPDWTDMQLASNPAVVSMKNMLAGYGKNLGLPDNMDSVVANFAARPPEQQTQAALSRAKEGPQHQALVQSEIDKNRAQAGLNPDQPGTPANGPALGDKRAASFNQRFAQEGQTDAPKVLSWGDARAAVSQKYGPDVAMKAELFLKGNKDIISGLRGSGLGQNNERRTIQNAAMELGRLTGMNPDEINQNFIDYAGKKAAATSGGRTAGSREANLGIILTAADSAIDAAITASNNVPRSDFVPLNDAKQWAQAKFSNEALQVFQQKNLQLADLWAKSFNPTGALRVDDRNLALTVLNTAIGQGTYEAAARAIRDSIGLEKSAAIKFLKDKGYSGKSSDNDDSGSEPGPGGVKVHGFTFTPTGQ